MGILCQWRGVCLSVYPDDRIMEGLQCSPGFQAGQDHSGDFGGSGGRLFNWIGQFSKRHGCIFWYLGNFMSIAVGCGSTSGLGSKNIGFRGVWIDSATGSGLLLSGCLAVGSCGRAAIMEIFL